MQANLVLVSETAAGKKITTTVSYINPDALNSRLKAFAIALNNMTTNSFISATRSTKNEDLDNPDPSGKLTPTLTVSTDGEGIITYNGDGTLSVEMDKYGNNYIFATIDNNVIKWNTGTASFEPDTHFSGAIYATEGETYKAASTTFEVWI